MGEIKIRDFTDLITWQEAHLLVLSIYVVTKKFPRDELFGLTNQMRRSAVSVTSNIAEGFGRKTLKEKIRFYYLAYGSLLELKSQVIIAKDLDYIKTVEFSYFECNIITIQKLMQGLIKSSKKDL